MADFFLILLGAAFINNVVLERLIGTDPALAFTHRQDVAGGLCLTMLVLLPLATMCSWLLDRFLLLPLRMEYLGLPVLVSAILIISLLLKQYAYRLHRKRGQTIRVFLPAAAINTTVLGVMLLQRESAHTLMQALAFGLGAALGFALVLMLLSHATERLETADVPAPFRGPPIQLLTLAVMAMAFMGFTGLIRI